MNTTPFSLEGKTILITGASSGIGRSTAIECSKMGAKIVLSARNIYRLNETLSNLEGEGHTIIPADITKEDELNDLVEQLPHVEGIVLCSGIGLTLPVQFCDREKMNNLFNINFFSTIEIVRLIYKKKKISKGGSIVFIDSIGGVTEFSAGLAIYGAAKAALNSFSKFCAREFATRKIRVNCICPGMIETPLIRNGTISDEQLAEDMKRYPCGRYGNPEEVAYGAIYLLSDATKWVTGTSVFIDGGASIV